ncbi:hypothetical protein GCM10009733_007010 [Nonomuraea maheshkhaliensis]|uniref:Uncharacterized protein n=1 Tax=Nonomuraea maheshkhaliensis TaxID=419590 RepID=A0ABN2EQU7_9ACTN
MGDWAVLASVAADRLQRVLIPLKGVAGPAYGEFVLGHGCLRIAHRPAGAVRRIGLTIVIDMGRHLAVGG